jgi:hypothetical protein
LEIQGEQIVEGHVVTIATEHDEQAIVDQP